MSFCRQDKTNRIVLSRVMLVHDLVPYLSSSVSSELKNIEREGWVLVESGSTWTLISDETPPLMRWLIELDLDLSESTFLATLKLCDFFNLDPFDEEKVQFDCAALFHQCANYEFRPSAVVVCERGS
jgi:hypothetical protein